MTEKLNNINKQEVIFCSCGCGTKLNKYDDRGRERHYIKNHSYKIKHNKQFKIGYTPWNKGVKGLMVSWNKGKTKKEDTRIAQPWLNKKRSEETCKKISKVLIGCKSWNKGKKASMETRKKMSKSHKGVPLTKEHIKNSLRRREKSSLEIRVDDVIKKYKLPYKFVGNGKFFIERKNPDFVNTNGKKVAVEVYCRKHKDLFRGGCDEWKEERQNIFKQYGWSILFIEDWQTNNEKKLLSILQKGG